jgi:hypothetical protein
MFSLERVLVREIRIAFGEYHRDSEGRAEPQQPGLIARAKRFCGSRARQRSTIAQKADSFLVLPRVAVCILVLDRLLERSDAGSNLRRKPGAKVIE